MLDAGAVTALRRTRRVAAARRHHRGRGRFRCGRPGRAGRHRTVPSIARGLVDYDAADLPALLGRKTADLPAEFRREIVHRDDLVLL